MLYSDTQDKWRKDATDLFGNDLMAKNISIFLFLIVVIGGGIGYSFYSDPELPAQQLFSLTVKEFVRNSESLENDFEARGSLTPATRTLRVEFESAGNIENEVLVNMRVSTNRVVLTFPIQTSILPDQTIILEPYKKDANIRWKCINGTVLIRNRDKNCRLGYGISRTELL